MIVTTLDGNILRTSVRNCTGFVAKRIEMEAEDFTTLLTTLRERPLKDTYAILAQLERRFPERRVPTIANLNEEIQS